MEKLRRFKDNTFAFAALLFEKSAEVMTLSADLLSGRKAIDISVVNKKREGGENNEHRESSG